jgi:hypothetical protein
MIDFLIEVNAIVLAIFGVGILGIFGKLNTTIQKKHDERCAEEEKVKDQMNLFLESNIALLKERIFEQCKTYIARKFVTFEELEELGELFLTYEKLGGNGIGKRLYNEVLQLPKKERV